MKTDNDRQRVLVVSAHPDDETLGCGGTLLRHRAAGDALFWLRVTMAHEPDWEAATIERKEAEVEAVAAAYGMEECFHSGFPAALLDTVPAGEIIEEIDEVVGEVRPGTVYLVHGGDIHSDHRALWEAAASVLKPFRMPALGVRRVLCYETLSSTEAAAPGSGPPFVPNVFCDITAHLEEKLRIMEIYASEAQADPMPRGPSAIRALARLRGATIGVEHAEAFLLLREVST